LLAILDPDPEPPANSLERILKDWLEGLVLDQA
jgi:hypothetical protein